MVRKSFRRFAMELYGKISLRHRHQIEDLEIDLDGAIRRLDEVELTLRLAREFDLDHPPTLFQFRKTLQNQAYWLQWHCDQAKRWLKEHG